MGLVDTLDDKRDGILSIVEFVVTTDKDNLNSRIKFVDEQTQYETVKIGMQISVIHPGKFLLI